MSFIRQVENALKIYQLNICLFGLSQRWIPVRPFFCSNTVSDLLLRYAHTHWASGFILALLAGWRSNKCYFLLDRLSLFARLSAAFIRLPSTISFVHFPFPVSRYYYFPCSWTLPWRLASAFIDLKKDSPLRQPDHTSLMTTQIHSTVGLPCSIYHGIHVAVFQYFISA